MDKKITCPEGTHVSGLEKGDRVCVMDRCPPGTGSQGIRLGKVVCPAGSVPSVSQEGLCLKTAKCLENAKRVKDKCVMEPACKSESDSTQWLMFHAASMPQAVMVDGIAYTTCYPHRKTLGRR